MTVFAVTAAQAGGGLALNWSLRHIPFLAGSVSASACTAELTHLRQPFRVEDFQYEKPLIN